MTDRELLELAAKAVKNDLVWCEAWKAMAKWLNVVDGYDWDSCWNPLKNDGDAFQLAVKLKIDVMFSHHIHPMHLHEQVTAFAADEKRCDEFIINDAKATRRAIVRAAAEIGKNQKDAA